MRIEKLTPAIGAVLHDITVTEATPNWQLDAIYSALLEHLVVFIRGNEISPAAHLAFAEAFGQPSPPHPVYPHADGFPQIMALDNSPEVPPDTNSWHTDLTFKAEQPFASVLVARNVPACGGDTIWASCHAAYARLPEGMRRDLEGLSAVHDMGDFRNTFAAGSAAPAQAISDGMARMGQAVRPLIGAHPVTGRPFLNFNPAFVTHILGMTTSESDALKAWLTNHVGKPEDQVRWRWQAGDLAMWDNRVTMHYAVADYLPAPRLMHRVTLLHDRRSETAHAAE